MDNTSDASKPVSTATQTELNAKANSADLSNVDNTSDANKPVSTATQTALNAKADTSAVPTDLNDLSDVSIVGTPAGNQALIYDVTAGAFKSQVSYTNRFEDEVETGINVIGNGIERAYSVKAEGDGIYLDASPDTPTAGKVIKRKIYQKTGFISDSDAIGDYTLIHTFADDTTYSNTVATFDGFEDGATYGAPPFTLFQTWEEVTAAPAFTGLLNETYGSGAAAAYSTRRLNGLYSGDCMTIRRASDSTTQSIGFVGEEIDESAITTFCTGTSCTIQVWKDQSGNGNDASQTDSTKQPTIYTGGQLVKEGGRLALDFDGTDDFFTTSWSAGTTASMTAFNTASPTNNTSSAQLYDLRDANNDGLRLIMFSDSNLFMSADFDDLRTTPYFAGQQLIYSNYVSSTISTGIDGGTVNSTSAPASTSVTANAELFRDNSSSFYFLGKAQESIFYLTDKSGVRTDIEGNISAYYQSAKLLDEQYGEGAEAAYSTRQLRRDQTDCMVIRRASDSTTTTIGFDASGNIDESAINTFCTGTTCTVSEWKDQSSNGNHATQSTPADQPTIYTGGAIVKRKGRAALNTTSSGEYLEFSSQTYADDFCLINLQTLTANDFGFGGASGNFAQTYRESNKLRWRFSGVTCDATIGLQITTEQYIGSVNRVGTNVNASLNGAALSVSGGTSGSMVLTTIMRGNGSTSAYVGDSQELIFYNDDKSTSDQASINSNIGDYFTQNTPLLDTYTGAAAAYSLRKLSSSYSGSAVEVYNGSSYADIGFNVFGELDTVALAAHCGSNDGFVSKWYSQTGSNDATQTTTANMPKIYDGTTGVVTENGKPAVDNQGGTQELQLTSSLTGMETIIAVAKQDNGATNGYLIGASGDNSLRSQGGWRAITGSPAPSSSDFYFNGSIYIDGVSLTSNLTTSNQILIAANSATGGYNYALELIGGTYPSRHWDGPIQELIIFSSEQSTSNRTGIETNLNTFYNIYS